MDTFTRAVCDHLDDLAYMRPAIAGLEGACSICRGALPCGSNYTSCYKCSTTLANGRSPFSCLGFGAYALSGEQDATDFRAYKGSQPSERAETMVTCLAYLGISEYLNNSPDIQAIVTVPSLSGRDGAHPLVRCVAKALGKIDGSPPILELLEGQAIPEHSRRNVDPNHFTVKTTVPKNVLIVDDTWTTGGHLTSAATALKHAGAKNVFGLALCRWLSPSSDYTGESIYKIAGNSEGFIHHDFFNFKPSTLF